MLHIGPHASIFLWPSTHSLTMSLGSKDRSLKGLSLEAVISLSARYIKAYNKYALFQHANADNGPHAPT
jgi:hypothetical protein